MWSAVILAGGRGSRLGRDKATMSVGGVRAVDRVLSALPMDVPVVVVGPDPGELTRTVTICREEPVGGGPAAGLAAGLSFVDTPLVGVLATDMPFAASVLAQLATALRESADGVVARDRDGRSQYLCSMFRTAPLRAALAGQVHDRAMHAVLEPLALQEYAVDDDDLLLDIDTVEDLIQAERRMEGE